MATYIKKILNIMLLLITLLLYFLTLTATR